LNLEAKVIALNMQAFIMYRDRKQKTTNHKIFISFIKGKQLVIEKVIETQRRLIDGGV
jgi:hypothetical protein